MTTPHAAEVVALLAVLADAIARAKAREDAYATARAAADELSEAQWGNESGPLSDEEDRDGFDLAGPDVPDRAELAALKRDLHEVDKLWTKR